MIATVALLGIALGSRVAKSIILSKYAKDMLGATSVYLTLFPYQFQS